MNYRHAFHAGNFADCVKHGLLVCLLRALHRKPGPLFVLDTHAGAGRYDLTADQARRTGEATAGIGRLLVHGGNCPDAAVADYLDLVRPFVSADPPIYPGSPSLIRALLRDQDHLACCELQPDDHAALRRLFARDPRVAVHHRDAWEALGALLPPRQKRALVLIDPPFEAPDEFDRLLRGLCSARSRMLSAVLVAWYPIKTRRAVRAFHDGIRVAPLKDAVTAELLLREPVDRSRLNGCGLLVVNPPYQFEAEAESVLRGLLAGLGTGEAGADARVERLTDE